MIGYFFDSKLENGMPDRPYDATDHAQFYQSFFSNGAFMRIDADACKVSYITSPQRALQVAPGRVFIDGYQGITEGDDIFQTSSLPNSHYRIIIRLDRSEEVRAFSCKMIQGTSITFPKLIREGNIYDLCLAEVIIADGSVVSLTDTRTNTELCGSVQFTGEQPFYGSVHEETAESTATKRVLQIPGVSSWEDVIDTPLYIKSRSVGTDSVTMVTIDGEIQTIRFITPEGQLTPIPEYGWTSQNAVYQICWTGKYLIAVSPTSGLATINAVTVSSVDGHTTLSLALPELALRDGILLRFRINTEITGTAEIVLKHESNGRPIQTADGADWRGGATSGAWITVIYSVALGAYIIQGNTSSGVVAGAYVGDDMPEHSFDLGFSPSAVAIWADGLYQHASGNTSVCGGMVVKGHPIVAKMGSVLFEITENGFVIRLYAVYNELPVSDLNNPRTTYHYIAWR